MFSGIQKLNQITQDVALASYGEDANLFVEFVWHPVKNEQKSIELGRDFYEEKEYIRIIAPGDKTKNWFRPVRKTPNGNVPPDTARWPRQWQAFQNQAKQTPDGTPLEECAFLSRADVMNLKGNNIYTLEQLAGLQDNNLTWMGARGQRDKAKQVLEKSKDSAVALKWEKEKEEMQAQIAAMQNQLQGFQNSGIVLPEKAPASPRKRGPKPKVKYEQDIPSTDTSGS